MMPFSSRIPTCQSASNSGCSLTITTARGSTLSSPTGIPAIHFVSNFEIVIEHVRQLWGSQTPDVMPGDPKASKTTHPTAHPRVYFWYLN
jgi:hypothetical protein